MCHTAHILEDCQHLKENGLIRLLSLMMSSSVYPQKTVIGTTVSTELLSSVYRKPAGSVSDS